MGPCDYSGKKVVKFWPFCPNLTSFSSKILKYWNVSVILVMMVAKKCWNFDILHSFLKFCSESWEIWQNSRIFLIFFSYFSRISWIFSWFPWICWQKGQENCNFFFKIFRHKPVILAEMYKNLEFFLKKLWKSRYFGNKTRVVHISWNGSKIQRIFNAFWEIGTTLTEKIFELFDSYRHKPVIPVIISKNLEIYSKTVGKVAK